MASALVLAALFFAGVASSGGATAQAQVGTVSRIVGGSPASIDRYPWLVQVESQGVFTGVWAQACAANILTSRYVVSGAQCFHGILYAPQYRRIRAGTSFRNSGGVVIYVESALNHPAYAQLGSDGDISLVRLQEAFVWTPVVQPGIIASSGTIVPDSTPVVYAGWGAVSEDGVASPELLDVTVYVVNNEVCAERYESLPGAPGRVTPNMICAGLLDVGGRDACQGDSGGPLYFGEILVGIIAWRSECGDNSRPSVNTLVSAYSDWIIQNAV